MNKTWPFVILIISVIIAGALYYWWYFTPRILNEKSNQFYFPNISFFEKDEDKVLLEKFINITYKGGMCEAEQIEFPKILSENNVNSLLSMANGIQFTKNDNSISGYIEFSLKKLNGPFTDGMALWKETRILIFFCEQTDSNEYIARWFVEKYG